MYEKVHAFMRFEFQIDCSLTVFIDPVELEVAAVVGT